MLHVPGRRRAQIGAGTGRRSVVLILTGLLLVATPVLGASASSCGPKGGCSTAKTSNGGTSATNGNGGTTATSGNGGASATNGGSTSTNGNGGSSAKAGNGGPSATTGSAGPATPPTASGSPHGPADQTTHHPSSHHGQAQNPSPATQPTGSGSTHHRSGGGHRHSRAGVSSKGSHVGSATTTAGIPPRAVTGRLNPPAASAGGTSSDGAGALPAVVVQGRLPRARMAEGFGATGAVARVAGALRFPAVLLGVILLFLTLQQRADRRDPKLANAPVGSRQETLEFR
jgi:hypothetical protein